MAAAAPPKAEKRASSRDTATLTAYFWEAYNEIVQPSRINAYLIDKWLPELGPVGFALVQAFRRRCYHNPKTGETRNEIEVDIAVIAKAIGVSGTTVHRELHRNEALKHFVKVQPQYEVQSPGKAPKRYMPAFLIAMDDPIHASDMERYDALRAQKEAERAKADDERVKVSQGSKFRTKGAAAPAAAEIAPTAPKLQNEIKGDAKLQNAPPKLHIAPPKLQFETDAPYISSSPSSLLNSLHSEDAVPDPPINSPKGEKKESGEWFNPLIATWNVALGLLAETINAPTMNTHLKLLRLVSISDAGEVVLSARSQFTQEWVKQRHLESVQAALGEAMGTACSSVQIVVETK